MRVLALLTSALALSRAAADNRPVDFVRDVRPLLAGKCFQCHGPDDKTRKAGLRLDTFDGATRELKSGNRAVVPGKPDQSELIARVRAEEPRRAMPPAKTGKHLSAEEVAVLTRWVEQGAPFPTHWGYVPPVRPPLPAVRDRTWPANPVDVFVLARLEREGLRPMPAADRYALARRVALDLTGLPPTPEEADAFVNDARPDAYERYVDRLLAGPRFGERWAQVWLDLARYADSQGFANDPDRTIWRWRDWVVQAFNHNLPYDRFTLEQLAGDLLPGAATSQLVATGFHRNTLTNTEGGTNPEEFRSAAVVDRVNTTAQVWLGTTLACAQCHNHKYDPFSQREYFQLYAIFNNTEDSNGGDDAPFVRVAAVGREREFAEADARLAAAKQKLDAETRQLDAKQAEWEKAAKRDALPKDVAAALPVAPEKRNPQQKQKLAAHHRSLSPAWKALDAEVRSLTARLAALGTTTPVLRETRPRPTHVQLRGNFQELGEAVPPGLPAALAGPAEGPVNRLTLARWLVDGKNPLTARVAVNRLWEEVFGVGLVETSEDFGTQGELPSHPELLDWLATQFVRTGWDTKAMLRLLVTSSAYRQSSAIADCGLRIADWKKEGIWLFLNPQSAIRNPQSADPANRLLARGPRVRLSAEAVRDQALSVGGLLSPKMYGPPVQPPRPSFGLAAAFGTSTDWQPSAGEDRYRRGLYVRWRRNAPYPSMTTFDAPERTYCNVRRLRTNTPLQALVTLNDPVFVEAAQALARRAVREAGPDPAARVERAFRLCLVRPPSAAEKERLVRLFEQARDRFRAEPAKATALATKPLGPAPQGADVAELAAWTVVANVLLNLDETIARR